MTANRIRIKSDLKSVHYTFENDISRYEYYIVYILIPVLWISRMFKALTVNRKRIQSEIKSVDDTIANMKK